MGGLAFERTTHSPVGICDVDLQAQTPGDQKSQFSGRLFYPCDRAALKRHWLEPRWLPHPNWASSIASFLFQKNTAPTIAKRWLATVGINAAAVLVSMEVLWNPPLAPQQDGTRLPVMVFSHGLGGMRNSYSIFCTEMAARGFAVLAVEHADGTACAARLADGGWLYYAGWPDKAGQHRQVEYRTAEVDTALSILRALDGGEAGSPALPGLSTSLPDAGMFAGALNLGDAVVVGHSYGGATAAAVGAARPHFKGAVSLDPWWPCLDPSTRGAWASGTPLLVVGSEAWNKPESMYCDGEAQRQVLSAVAGGPGGLLVVPAGTNHHSFADLKFLGVGCPLAGWFSKPAPSPAEAAMHLTVRAVERFVELAGVRLPGVQYRAAHQPTPVECPEEGGSWAATLDGELRAAFGPRLHHVEVHHAQI